MWETSFFGFSLSEGFTVLKPLALFIIGMALYCIFIFKFYKFVSRRDVFGGGKKGEEATLGLRVFEYLFLYPVALFFWYLIFFTFMLLLTETQTVENMMLMAMAMIGTIRVTAYFKEELSNDLAKIIPFALLAIFLIDISAFSLFGSLEIIKLTFTNPATLHILVYYFLFIIGLEFILRIAHHVGSTPPSRSRINILAMREEKKQAVEKFEEAKK